MQIEETPKEHRPLILVVDDESAVRHVLEDIVRAGGYDCITAGDGQTALELLPQHRVDVVLTDIRMPQLDGINLMARIKSRYGCDVILMTGFIEDFSYGKAIEQGASDFIQKPVGAKELLLRLRRVLRERAVVAERNQAEEQLKTSLDQVNKTLEGLIRTIERTVEIRDPYTAGHQRRVAELACAMARKIGLPENQIFGIRMAGRIHDLGKISIPAEILTKPGGLNDIEFELIKTHSKIGYDILKKIEFPWPVAQIVYQHHEKIDGSGYPQGLTAGQILLEAKIMSIADTLETISSHRPYRPALGLDAALAELTNNKGILYDEELVEVCLEVMTKNGFDWS